MHLAAKQPNPNYKAHSFQHTQEAFPDWVHFLADQPATTTSCSPAVLQCITNLQDLHVPLHLPPGIKLLLQEQPSLAAYLEPHAGGYHVLSEKAMQAVPLKGTQWQRLRQICIIGSNLHIMLGFHEAASSELGITKAQRKHSEPQSLVDQLQRASTSPVHNASTSFNLFLATAMSQMQ